MNGPLFNNGGKALQDAMKFKAAAEAIDYFTWSPWPAIRPWRRTSA